jgi:avermitilol synthase
MGELPTFEIPFPVRSSPDVARARADNVSRMKSHGMLASPAAERLYLSWDMAQLAGYCYPDATGDDLDLAVDLVAFFFVFDDQFDSELGRDPAGTSAFAGELIQALHHRAGGRRRTNGSPLVTFFADLWRRTRQEMPASWSARAAGDWEYYFASQAAEAMDRVAGQVPSWDHFLQVRRGTAGTRVMVDYIERVGRFVVPLAVFHTPQYRMMRLVATDVPLLCNDVRSVYKEAPRGDMDNAVLVVEHERGCTRDEALKAVWRLVMADHIPRFQLLERQLPLICATLNLTGPGHTAVDRSVAGMKAWISGYHRWETETRRYAPGQTIPADRPNYLEALLT